MTIKKHIKKRYLNVIKDDKHNLPLEKAEQIKIGSSFKNKDLTERIPFLEFDSGEIVGGILHKNGGNIYGIPVPNPTLVYLSFAQSLIKPIEETKLLILKETNLRPSKKQIIDQHKIYDYYGKVTTFIIHLALSVESFTNYIIDPKKEFDWKEKGHKMKMTKQYLQIQASLTDKIEKILPQQFDKRFNSIHNTEFVLITKELKTLRDDLVHTKTESNTLYQDLMKRVFKVDPNKLFNAVVTFMNFHKPEFVCECNCDSNH